MIGLSISTNLMPCFRLEQQVLDRFEKENGGQLLVAALCLLETSATGLLETELLKILGDEETLLPKDKGEKEGKGISPSLNHGSKI